MGAVSPHVDHKEVPEILSLVSMPEVTLNEKMCQRVRREWLKKERARQLRRTLSGADPTLYGQC